MKFLSILLVLLSFSLPAFTAETKIAYIDLQKAIQSTKAGKKARAQLEKEFKAKESQLKKKEENLRKRGEELQKKAALLSEDARRKKEAEFQQDMIKFRQEVQKSQQSIANKERKMTEPILKKMEKIVEKVAKEGGYTMVLEKQGQSILWAKKEADITSEVIKAFEK